MSAAFVGLSEVLQEGLADGLEGHGLLPDDSREAVFDFPHLQG